MRLHIFSGSSNIKLANEICEYLGRSLSQAEVRKFSDRELYTEIKENVRGSDVYLIQSTSSPVNDNIMELLIMLDTLKRSSAASITAVIPYYGYARQDRKVAPRTPITSKLVADLLQSAGASRVIAMDLHAGQIQAFFNFPCDHIFAMPVFMQDLKMRFDENVVVVSPDAGGAERARAYSKRLHCSMGIIDKRRSGANIAQVMHVIGDVEGKDVVILDDIIDTAGTLVKGVEALKEQGCKDIYAYCTHPVLSGPAIERLCESDIKEVVVTNTICTEDKQSKCDKLRVLSVAPLLGEAIRRIHNCESVSSLFV